VASCIAIRFADQETVMNEHEPSRNSDPYPDNNLAVVKRLYDAFGRRDIEAVLGELTEDVQWSEPENPFNPAAGTRQGHEGFLEWVRIGNAAEEVMALELRDFLVTGNKVAAVGRTTCRVRSTGKVYETDFVHLIDLRNGRVARFQEFFDTYAAGEAFRP
jgi:hypothetical protein